MAERDPALELREVAHVIDDKDCAVDVGEFALVVDKEDVLEESLEVDKEDALEGGLEQVLGGEEVAAIRMGEHCSVKIDFSRQMFGKWDDILEMTDSESNVYVSVRLDV